MLQSKMQSERESTITSSELLRARMRWNEPSANGFVCVNFDSVYCRTRERILKHIDFGNYLKRNDFVHTTDIFIRPKSSNTITTATEITFRPTHTHTATHIKTLTCILLSVRSHIAKAFKRLKFSLIRQVHCFPTFWH